MQSAKLGELESIAEVILNFPVRGKIYVVQVRQHLMYGVANKMTKSADSFISLMGIKIFEKKKNLFSLKILF